MLMKIIIGFIAFLLIVGCVTASSEPSSDDSHERWFFQHLNEARRWAAKEYQIDNMHKLFYDKTLAELAGSQDWSHPKANDRFTEIVFLDGEAINQLKNASAGLKALSQDHQRKIMAKPENAKLWEHFNPLQTKMGCARKPPRKTTFVCVYGHRKTLTGWDDPKNSPGAQCLANYKNTDGLCTPTPKFLDDYNSDKFIERVNVDRRDFANEYGNKNMHALVFDANLASIAKKLVWTGDFRKARQTWRYTLLKSYESGTADANTAFDIFLKTELNKQIDIFLKGENHFLESLEYIIPRQKSIGCSKKDGLPPGYTIVCLFGPEKSLGSYCFDTTMKNATLCTQTFVSRSGQANRTPRPPSPQTTPAPTPAPANPPPPPDPSSSVGGRVVDIPLNSPTSSSSPPTQAVQGAKGPDGKKLPSDDTKTAEVAKPPAEVSITEKLVDEFNEARRKYANFSGRKDVYELTLSNKLVGVAERVHNYIKRSEEEHKSYRNVSLKFDGLHTTTDNFLRSMKMNGYDINTQIAQSNPVPSIEYLLPHQRDVGCANIAPDSGGRDVFCVFSPETTLNSWNVSNYPNCYLGYHLNNSLCVEDPPWEYVPATTMETELDRIIAKYKQEEKEGDLPDPDEKSEEDGASVNFSVMTIIVVFVVMGLV